MRRWALRFACVAAASVFAHGCRRGAREDTLVVFAAASLREAFTAVGEDFQRAHPGVRVTFNFAGTQELHAQIDHGAPADVFAAADVRHMDALAGASRVSSPVVFARNEPVVVVVNESPIHDLSELPNARQIVVGTPDVPIGRYTLDVLDRAAARYGGDYRARVEAKVVSRELDVRHVLAKVSLGEAEAGFVYRTDARSASDRVRIVSIPPELDVTAEYPIAIVTGAPHPGLARAFVDHVLSEGGQRALRGAGFVGPRGASP